MFTLNNDLNLDIDKLKLKAMIISKNMQLPDEIAAKIREMVLNDDISGTEFIAQFNNLVEAYQPKGWKTALLFSQIKSVLALIAWTKIGIATILIFLVYFLIKKYKLQKRIKKLYAMIFNIFERFGALCAYFVPLVSIYTAYIQVLLPRYPYLNFILPNFMLDAMDFYMKHPWTLNYGYFFTTMYTVTLFKLPKPRFIRFHLVRGLMLLAFQGIPDSCFKAFQSADSLTQDQIVTTTLCLFSINLSWILPCMYQAITYTYPRSSFIRDAIEINVGRDKDEGFKWWDRR